MKKLLLTTLLVGGLATAAVADPAKPKMSKQDFEKQMIVSTHDAPHDSALVMLMAITALVIVAALSSGGTSNAMSY